MRKTSTVESSEVRLGRFGRLNASLSALILLPRVSSRWKSAMIAPSNSAPRAPVTVYGEKAFQMIDSQMLVAMKSEMPEPMP